jgi:hypothetical protein
MTIGRALPGRRVTSRWTGCLALCALGAVTASVARAEEPGAVPSRVILVRPGCEGSDLDEGELVRLLEIELLADGVGELHAVSPDASGSEGGAEIGSAPGASLAVLRLEGVCGGEGPMSVTIDDAATDKRVRRDVDLGGVSSDARPRAIALAIAELLRASWMELVLPSAPTPKAIVPPEVREAARGRAAAVATPSPTEGAPADPLGDGAAAPPPAVELSTISPPALDRGAGDRGSGDRGARAPERADAGARTQSRVWLGGGAGLRGFLDGDALFGGGRLEALFPIAPPLRGRAGIAAGYSPGEHELGDIDLFLLSGRGALCLSLAGERYLVELGPFLELGWGYARGEPNQDLVVGDDVSALIALTGATVGARFELTGATWLDASVDFGPTLSGLSAVVDGSRERSIDGLALGGNLGLVWALGDR